MKHLYATMFFFSLIALASCEKGIAEEGQDNTPTAGITEGDRKNALTVAQAQQAAAGTQICVKGYLVASTQKSMNNADFFSPFEGSTAIVLADKNSDSYLYDDDLFPICLTDASKGIRDAYNLEAHPEYHNQFVYILGTREQYLSTAGLKKVKGIEVDPNHVATPDEQGDTPSGDEGDTPGNPDNPETPDTPENPDASGNPETPDTPSIPTSNVLTVAEAKSQKENAQITVQGYIVAAVSGGKDYISFESPTFGGNNTAIVLADKKYEEGTTFDTTGYSDLYIIYLADSPKNIKEELCLPKHPNNQNRLVKIKGKVGFYFGMKLLIKVESYQWITP